jgi:hypothetical protein
MSGYCECTVLQIMGTSHSLTKLGITNELNLILGCGWLVTSHLQIRSFAFLSLSERVRFSICSLLLHHRRALEAKSREAEEDQMPAAFGCFLVDCY